MKDGAANSSAALVAALANANNIVHVDIYCSRGWLQWANSADLGDDSGQ